MIQSQKCPKNGCLQELQNSFLNGEKCVYESLSKCICNLLEAILLVDGQNQDLLGFFVKDSRIYRIS